MISTSRIQAQHPLLGAPLLGSTLSGKHTLWGALLGGQFQMLTIQPWAKQLKSLPRRLSISIHFLFLLMALPPTEVVPGGTLGRGSWVTWDRKNQPHMRVARHSKIRPCNYPKCSSTLEFPNYWLVNWEEATRSELENLLEAHKTHMNIYTITRNSERVRKAENQNSSFLPFFPPPPLPPPPLFLPSSSFLRSFPCLFSPRILYTEHAHSGPPRSAWSLAFLIVELVSYRFRF